MRAAFENDSPTDNPASEGGEAGNGPTSSCELGVGRTSGSPDCTASDATLPDHHWVMGSVHRHLEPGALRL